MHGLLRITANQNADSFHALDEDERGSFLARFDSRFTELARSLPMPFFHGRCVVEIDPTGTKLLVGPIGENEYQILDAATLALRETVILAGADKVLLPDPDQFLIQSEDWGPVTFASATGRPFHEFQIEFADLKATSLHAEYLLMHRDEEDTILLRADGKAVKHFESTGFTILDAVFSANRLAYTEAGGALTVVSLRSMTVLFRKMPPPGWHFLQVALSEDDARVAAFCGCYETGTEGELVTFDIASEATLRSHRMNIFPESAFIEHGRTWVTGGREAYDTETGERIAP